MLRILLFLLFMPFISMAQGSKNPFLTLKFDKVVMYDFEGGKGADLSIIDQKGQVGKIGKKNNGSLIAQQ